ncbi:MAG TPA: cupin domain-containing protein [Saprospiraceae bacterium]|nr:cupin domain-containing protein [Saprospiraceae bacterium]
MHKINLSEKFDLIQDHWNPRIAGELNGQQVKLVKFKGEFIWHKHEDEDEMFFVVQGEFDMHLREKVITLRENEFIIIPKGVEHKPVATNEVSVMLFEPASTLNTGDKRNEMTKEKLGRI